MNTKIKYFFNLLEVEATGQKHINPNMHAHACECMHMHTPANTPTKPTNRYAGIEVYKYVYKYTCMYTCIQV